MRKQFVACLLLLCSLNVRAQLNPDVQRYNQYVNRAELLIMDSNIAKAADYYRHAFALAKGHEQLFDVTNAFFCAMDIGDKTLAENCFKKMLASGISQEFFSDNIWAYYHGKDSAFLRGIMVYTKNQTGKQSASALYFKKLVAEDEKARSDFYAQYPLASGLPDSILRSELQRVEQLLRYVDEQLLADKISEAGTEKDDPSAYPAYAPVLLHYFDANGAAGRNDIISSTLLKWMNEWKIGHRFFFDIMLHAVAANDQLIVGNDRLPKTLSIPVLEYKQEGQPAVRVLPSYATATEQQANVIRQRFGIESLEETRRKSSFYYRYHDDKGNIILRTPLSKYYVNGAVSGTIRFTDRAALDEAVAASRKK